MNSAIIVSGGLGTRFGGDTPKQFIKINGQEILSFSVKTFLNHPQIDEVIIVSPKKWRKHVISQYPECHVVLGGKRRQDSSLNGVMATSDKSTNVLIHDAVRPFISSQIISKCLSALKTFDASAPIIPSIESMVKWNGKKADFIDRAEIQIVQTPQCFKKHTIIDILKSNFQGTDEIGMLLKFHPNSKIKLIDGNIDNIKITSQNDMKYFSKSNINGS